MQGSFFTPVPRWSMDDARRHIESHPLESYNLIDVRQPEEYAAGHIPGATLIPLAELTSRLDELDADKLTLVYCHSGPRASGAAALLTHAGFDKAYNIGGIVQWRGLAATGAPEAAMAVFDAAREPTEYVSLAWSLEESARRYYLELGEHFPALTQIFGIMAEDEGRHRDQLANLQGKIAGPSGGFEDAESAEMMEGGIPRAAALEWAKARNAFGALELIAAMEANAHDRYIVVGRAIGGDVERAFLGLADAEKSHLERLTRLLGKHARSGRTEVPFA